MSATSLVSVTALAGLILWACLVRRVRDNKN